MAKDSGALSAALAAYLERFGEHLPLMEFMGYEPDILADMVNEAIRRGEPLRRDLPEGADT